MSREMKHSGIPWIGDIPKHWEVMPHKRIMHKEKEIQEYYDGESILSLTMRGIIARDLEAGGKMPTTFDGYQKVYVNDLLQCLFDIDVTPRCVGLVRQDGLVSPAYSRFVMDANAYAPYYDYLLRFMDDNKVLLHLSKNIRSSLTETDFGTIYTCVPPLSEQKAIADYLDIHSAEVDEMVALQEKIIEELRAYRQAIITETVTRGLNPNAPMKDSGVEWIGQIPERWDVNKTIRLFETIGSGTTPKFDDIIEERNINWLQSGDINGGYIEKAQNQIPERILNQYSALKIYTSPYIIIAMYGASIGNTAISLIDACVNQACCVLQKSKQIQSYFFYALQSAKSYWNMLSVGGGQPNISQEIIKQTWLPVPPLHEQQEIADYLDKKTVKIDQLIAIKKQKIEELKAYKKSLIYEYVTGKKQI